MELFSQQGKLFLKLLELFLVPVTLTLKPATW
jgi:hypothetical protein